MTKNWAVVSGTRTCFSGLLCNCLTISLSVTGIATFNDNCKDKRRDILWKAIKSLPERAKMVKFQFHYFKLRSFQIFTFWNNWSKEWYQCKLCFFRVGDMNGPIWIKLTLCFAITNKNQKKFSLMQIWTSLLRTSVHDRCIWPPTFFNFE